MKKLFFICSIILISMSVRAQILKPVKWSYAAKRTSPTEAIIYLKATIDKGWHIYSQYVKEGGPVPTSFKFSPSPTYALIGKTVEPKPVTKYESTFKMDVSFFEASPVFQQKVKLKKNATSVKGTLEYMVCDDHQCLPPEEVEFTVALK